MLVQKFGGSSLADFEGFEASAALVKQYSADEPVAVVLSAVYGVTDLSIEAISKAARGEDARSVIEDIINRETSIVSEIAAQGHGTTALDELLARRRLKLESRLDGIRLLGECPDRSFAEILASGEKLSSRIMAAYLQLIGVRATWSDSHILPPANDSWLDSLVDVDRAAPLLREAMKKTRVLVLPGFHASAEPGRYQLLGRNGSDYSAACVAAALGARSCQIWKNVDGFYTADPGMVTNAQVLSEVSYGEAMELSFYGAGVISSKALAPLASEQIPCEIRNTYQPELPGSVVHAAAAGKGAVRGISRMDNVAVITIAGTGMRGRVGIAQRVMSALASSEISVLLIVQSSSEYSISLCVHSQQAEKARKALEQEFHFERLHDLVTEVTVLPDRAVVTLVGDGMKRNRGIAARFLTANSAVGVNVEVIAQGSTERAISLVVDRADAVAAVRASHTAFFRHVSHIDVILLGCGLVGSELLAQFHRMRPRLADSQHELKVRAIANSRRLLVATDELDAGDWQPALETEGQPYTLDDVLAIREKLGLLNPTIVDCTTNDDLAGQYALFLANGFNVVCANKKGNTASMAYYRQLRDTAMGNHRKFLYETNVGAGLPVIDTIQGMLRSGDQLRVFEGILSGSLSMIFGLLEDGIPFSEAVKKAKALGFTEPDPRDDLSGMDVARKLLIIAREVGMEMELGDIDIMPVISPDFAENEDIDGLLRQLSSLDADFTQRIEEAAENQAVLRYVGRISQGRCKVSIEAVARDKPLAAVRDGENALVMQSDYYQPLPLVLRGYGAGAEVTAAGVFADVLRTAWRPLDQ